MAKNNRKHSRRSNDRIERRGTAKKYSNKPFLPTRWAIKWAVLSLILGVVSTIFAVVVAAATDPSLSEELNAEQRAYYYSILVLIVQSVNTVLLTICIFSIKKRGLQEYFGFTPQTADGWKKLWFLIPGFAAAISPVVYADASGISAIKIANAVLAFPSGLFYALVFTVFVSAAVINSGKTAAIAFPLALQAAILLVARRNFADSAAVMIELAIELSFIFVCAAIYIAHSNCCGILILAVRDVISALFDTTAFYSERGAATWTAVAVVTVINVAYGIYVLKSAPKPLLKPGKPANNN